MARLLESQDARIEWSRYVDGDDVVAAWRMSGHGFVDYLEQSDEYFDPEFFPARVVLVHSSSRGLVTLYPSFRSASDGVRPSRCLPAEPGDREDILDIFDAHTGDHISTLPEEPTLKLLLRDLEDVESISEHIPMSEDRAPRGSITLPPEKAAELSDRRFPVPGGAVELSPEELRAALPDLMGYWPLVPGATFVWRDTARDRGVSWGRSWYTETVESAWRTDDGAIKVRIFSSRRYERPSSSSADPEELDDVFASERWIQLTERGAVPLFDDPWRMTRIEAEQSLNEVDRELRGDRDLESPIFLEPSLHGGPMMIIDQDASVQAAGREFDGCTVVAHVASAGAASYRWHCPGIGLVRSEFAVCYTNAQQLSVQELMSFDLPEDLP